jgi:hypothetical protein
MRALWVLLLVATPAQAEDLITAQEFDTLTQGRSMTWSEFGSVYGVEEYLPGRRVRWSAVGKDCKLGHWYEDGPAICFKYEDDIVPDCWFITRSDTGFSARYTANSPEAEPVVVTETLDPPACFGPEVGV